MRCHLYLRERSASICSSFYNSRMTAWTKSARHEKTSFGQLSRSELMARVKSRGNKTTELRFVELLNSWRFVGWRRHPKLTGNPDFYWPKHGVVVFIHGCFWHGHGCSRNLRPKCNATLWEEKIAATKARDSKNARLLRKEGLAVLTFWECQLQREPSKIQARLATRLLRRKGATRVA